MVRRRLLKYPAEASHPGRIDIHRAVVDDDAVTLVPAQEGPYRTAQEDDVTQAVRRQCPVIFRI